MNFILLGKRIREERQALRLTLEQLAEKINKTGNYLGQIERGDRKLSLETLVDISNALKVSIDYLLTDNIRISDNNIIREIDSIINTADTKSQRFILDVARRCKEYCE